MNTPVALYTDIVDIDPTEGIALLAEAGFDVRVANSADEDVIAKLGADADALLIGYSSVTRALIDAMPRLKIVATQSVGLDMVDLEACAERGIVVANLPSSATEEVASHAFALSLALVRGLHSFDRATQAGRWDAMAADLSRPSTLTAGVLGLGRIGRAFARYATGTYGRVVGYDPADVDVPEVERFSLEEVLCASDVLSLHLPLTADTRHLLNRECIGKLRPGARVINVSRGGLIDAQALREALDDGRLSGAGLDVFTAEPPLSDDPLWGHPRVLATPHAAYLSPHSRRDYVVHQAEHVLNYFREATLLS